MKLIKILRKIDNYKRNIYLNYIFKFISMILGLMVVKINLKYLGASLYGLWVTIASIVSWMSSGDFGIGNGLRNKLAEAYGNNNINEQYKYIATAVNILSKVSIGLFAIIIIICELLFKFNVLVSVIRIPMYITAAFFCINLVVGISQSIAYSIQKSWLTSLTNCSVQLLSVIFVSILNMIKAPQNLILFSVVNGICTTLPNICLLLLLNNKFLNFINQIHAFYDKRKIRDILNVGFQFFALQLCSIILFSTDSVIISNLFGSSQVTTYSVVSKVYDTGAGLFSVLLMALWSAVTLKIIQNDVQWIKNQIKQLIGIWLMFCLGVLIVSLNINKIICIWLGEENIIFNNMLVFVFATYCVVTTGYGIFVNILNGMGKVKLQLILAICESVVNIPLSVFLGKSVGLGIMGVKLATLLCVCVSAVILPIQTIKILKERDGILK